MGPVDPDFFSTQTSESRRFYLNLNPPPSAPLTVVCGGVERTQVDYVVQRSDFPYYGVELVTEGLGELDLGSARHRLSHGSVFAYGPGVPHRIANVPPGGMKKYFLDLVGTEAEQLFREAGLLNGTMIHTERVFELTDLWDSIDREARDNSPISHRICELLSRTLLLKLKQRQITSDQRTSTAYQTFESIRTYIEDNFLEVKTIEDVAEACGVTSAYVSRLFKKYNSVGAYRLLMRLRMNHAADLLIHNKLLVSEVAQAMNFSDQFQFTRAFKREYGVPPSELTGRG
tara:strand:- start:388261 stop:389121 length:861 start_codon:yes stop_codon:yes gene_type:complete